MGASRSLVTVAYRLTAGRGIRVSKVPVSDLRRVPQFVPPAGSRQDVSPPTLAEVSSALKQAKKGGL